MPYAGYHLACPELVNSHLAGGGSQRADVELGDGVGECQEENCNQESLFYSSEAILPPLT